MLAAVKSCTSSLSSMNAEESSDKAATAVAEVSGGTCTRVSLPSLPRDAWVIVLRFADVISACSLSAVSRALRSTVCDDELRWKTIWFEQWHYVFYSENDDLAFDNLQDRQMCLQRTIVGSELDLLEDCVLYRNSKTSWRSWRHKVKWANDLVLCTMCGVYADGAFTDEIDDYLCLLCEKRCFLMSDTYGRY
jgi:hypothetical protein